MFIRSVPLANILHRFFNASLSGVDCSVERKRPDALQSKIKGLVNFMVNAEFSVLERQFTSC